MYPFRNSPNRPTPNFVISTEGVAVAAEWRNKLLYPSCIPTNAAQLPLLVLKIRVIHTNPG
jgi:hypothetical protein